MEKKTEATVFIIVCIPGIPKGTLFLRNSCVMVLFHFERSPKRPPGTEMDRNARRALWTLARN